MSARPISYVLVVGLAGFCEGTSGCEPPDSPGSAAALPGTSRSLHHPPAGLSLTLGTIKPRYLTVDHDTAPKLLTISGSGFEPDMTITIGSDSIEQFSVVSPTVLRLAWSPTSSRLGPVPVSITASSGSTIQRDDLLYSRPPAIADLSFRNICEKIGYSPTSVAVADLNGDGIDDIVTANDLVPEIVYALSDGQGNIKSGLRHIPISEAYELQVADMNHDGIMDLVVITYSSTEGAAVGIMAGDGILGFGPLRNFANTQLPSSIAIGDFNKDGWSDIAVASQPEGIIKLYTNKKNKLTDFNSPKSLDSSAQPRALYFADIDNDANLDLLFLSEADNKGVVLFGNGIDAVSRREQILNITTGAPQLLLVEDVNDDNFKDLIVSSAADSTVNIWRNEKGAAFSLNNTLQAGRQPTAVVAADFNGDAKIDIAVSNGGSSDIGIFTQTKSNDFNKAVRSFASDLTPVGMRVARLHAGANPDLVVANRGLCTVSLLLNDVPLMN